MDLQFPPKTPVIGFSGLKLTGYLVEGSSSRHSVQISWESNSSNAMHPKDFLIERMNDGLDFLLSPRDKTRYAYVAIDSPFMGPSDEFMIIFQELDAESYKEVIDYLLTKKAPAMLGKPPKKYLVIVDPNIANYETLIATVKQFKLEYFTNIHEALVDAFIP